MIRRVSVVALALVVVAITPAGTVAEETKGETAQSASTLTTPASSDAVTEVNATSVAEEISGGEAGTTVTAFFHDPGLPFPHPTPTVTTTASGGGPVGTPVSDTAFLNGGLGILPGFNPGGSITFTLFGPDDATCSGTPVFTSTVSVTFGPAGSPTVSTQFTPTAPGTYRWIAAYSGNPFNGPATTACNDPNESVVITGVPTSVTTTASPDIVLGGGTLSDTATLTGGITPTGTVTFSLFGPNDATCAGPAIFTSTVPVAGNGSYVSAQFTPTTAGTYRWIASYSGDANNVASSGVCNDANESVVVAPAGVTITTNASPDIELGGGTLTDIAVVSGRVNPLPGATIDFRLYGPGDALCTAPIFQSLNVTYPVAGGPVISAAFTPTQAGTYRWIASYSGDANNAPVTGACNAPNETTVVSQRTTAVTTTASPDIVLGGGTLSDTATLTGGITPTGTVTFSLFGPNNATCAGPPIFNSIEPVAGNGSYVSAQFTPTSAGTYRWIASYSGDANNLPSSGACNDTNETAVVAVAGPTIITNASPGIELGGGTLSDTATVVGRVNPLPGASIDFRLYGPGDALCAGTPVFESLNVPYPATEGPVTSTAFTPTQVGTYRWVASYSGDANNAPITGACNAPNETVVVTEAAGVPAGSPATTQAGGLVTSAAPVRAAQLPRTGIDPQRQIVLALLFLIGGALLLLTSKTHLATHTPRHKNGRYTPRHH